MDKISWRTLRAMDKTELKSECKRLSTEIEELSNWNGNINNDEQHDEFLDDFHGIRNAIEGFYFNNID